MFAARCGARDRERQVGVGYGFGIFVDERFAGEINLSGIQRGAFQTGHIGYWIDEAFAGLGIIPTALAMSVDHCFGVVGLHRLEASIRPENRASRRVVEKLGFREEGIRVRQLHINGAWRDHVCYALTAEEMPQGLLPKWRSIQMATRPTAS